MWFPTTVQFLLPGSKKTYIYIKAGKPKMIRKLYILYPYSFLNHLVGATMAVSKN